MGLQAAPREGIVYGTQTKTPMVIFWAEEAPLWAFALVPAYPALLELLRFILPEVGKRGYQTVTVTRYYEGEEVHASNPCRAIDFLIGGIDEAKAKELIGLVNAQWIHGGTSERSGKPLRVLLYRKQEGGLYFHAEVTDTTCRKGANEGN